MDGSWDVDSSEGLTQLLSHVQVPEQLQTALQQTGLSSVSDFAYAYTSSEDLATFIAKQSQSLWDELQVMDPEHCPAVARLRRALDMSKAITRAKDSNPSTAPPSTSATPAANVWAEHAPPRLDSDAVQQRMQSTFEANYPGERLDNDCMPSIRLLSLVHLWFAPRGTIKWIPWQLRMSHGVGNIILEHCCLRNGGTSAGWLPQNAVILVRPCLVCFQYDGKSDEQGNNCKGSFTT